MAELRRFPATLAPRIACVLPPSRDDAAGDPASRDAGTSEPIVQEDGFVRVPSGPGLGIDVDRAALERFRA